MKFHPVAVEGFIPAVPDEAPFGGADGHEEQEIAPGILQLLPVGEAHERVVVRAHFLDGDDRFSFQGHGFRIDLSEGEEVARIAVPAGFRGDAQNRVDFPVPAGDEKILKTFFIA